MLKVIYLRSSFDPGGTETLLLNLFNYEQDKLEFHYVFLKNSSLISKLQSSKNKYYKFFRKWKLDFSVLLKVSRIIKDENITVIHTHQMFELLYAVLLKLCFLRLKIFHTIHGFFDEKNRWAPLFESFLIRFTKQTFTVSKASKNILKEKAYPANKINILYNAVSIPPVASKNEINDFKKNIHYQTNDFIAGMIGSFVWQKDQQTIIKAFNLLKKKLPDLKIVLIGKESELSEKCKFLLDKEDINTRVFFLGTIENAGKYLPLFDLFIMSSLMDTFGIVVIEALLQNTPVIASDIEVMKELSRNGKHFSLFKKGDSSDLSIKLEDQKNLKGSEIIRRKINETYDYTKSRFNFNAYILSLFNQYKKSIK